MLHLSRSYMIRGLVLMVGVIFVCKLFAIQVLNSAYTLAAEKNIVQRIDIPPYRGIMYGRHRELLVYNEPIYDLLVNPGAVKHLDTLAFCETFGISVPALNKALDKAKRYSYLKSSTLIKNIDPLTFAKVQDQLAEYRGFTIRARTVRSYPYPILANTLGYIGEISPAQLEADTNHYYSQADLVGISGLEHYYESQLRGKRGYQYLITNAKGQEKGHFKNGTWDVLPISGQDITLTIDKSLQLYGEQLMKKKVGSIVAIQPATGEILAMVSSPSYDPNWLSGKNFCTHFAALEKDPLHPLFNRAIMAMYPPGSIFKLVQALIALQEKLISLNTTHTCNKSLVNCHVHPSPSNLHQAIQYSCNPYFYHVFRKIINRNIAKNVYEDTRIGLVKWLDYVKQFGLGKSLAVDIPHEKGGYLPDVNFYNNRYGQGAWKVSTIRSLDIGQGEILLTPLQMANLATIIANRGYYYQPHLVKAIDQEVITGDKLQKHEVAIEKVHFDTIIGAMRDAVANGPAWRANVQAVSVCAKTGTAENPHGADHAICIGFAPLQEPQIAIAVCIENAGWGARAGAAIAGLMIEKYLKPCIERNTIEQYVLKGDFSH